MTVFEKRNKKEEQNKFEGFYNKIDNSRNKMILLMIPLSLPHSSISPSPLTREKRLNDLRPPFSTLPLPSALPSLRFGSQSKPEKGLEGVRFLDALFLNSKKGLVSFLLRKQGITSVEVKNPEFLVNLREKGDHLILTANHRGVGDSLIAYQLSKEEGAFKVFLKRFPFQVPSFFQSRLGTIFFLDQKESRLSALEEGKERVKVGQSPLIIFPEGAPTYENDRVKQFFKGAASIALSVASGEESEDSKSEKEGLKPVKPNVAIVPMGIKYVYQGDVLPALIPFIRQLEEVLGIQAPDEEITTERMPIEEVTLEKVQKRILTLWDRLLKEKQRALFPAHGFEGTLNQRYEELQSHLKESLFPALNVEKDETVPMFGLLKRLGKALDQKEKEYQKNQKGAQNGASLQEIQGLKEQMRTLIYLHLTSPDYIQGHTVTQERLVESVHFLNQWVNDQQRELRSNIIEKVGARHVKVQYGEPVYMAEYLKGYSSNKEEKEQTLFQVTQRIQRHLQETLDQS